MTNASPETPQAQAPQEARSSHDGHKQLWTTVLASLVLSTSATYSANNEHGDEHFGGPDSGVGVGIHDILPGDTNFLLPGVGADIHRTETKETVRSTPPVVVYGPDTTYETHVVTTEPMAFARQFAADPYARESLDGDAALGTVVEYIRDCIADGKKIKGISVHGYASAEDESGGYDDGLNTPSQQNVALAQERAQAGFDKLLPMLKQTFGDEVANKLRVTGGTEIQDPELNQAIFALAQSRNISPHELMEQYKFNPNSLTDQEREVLQGLDEDRYTAFTIETSETESVPYYELKGEEWVEKSKETTHGKFVLILVPAGLLLPSGTSGARGNNSAPVVPTPVVPRRTSPPWPQDNSIQRGSKVKESPGHAHRARHQKQPGQHNNGGNNGTRGQGGPHVQSKYQQRKNKARSRQPRQSRRSR
ncbi:hypothetical protein CSA80_05205 [Candidatus Saccharibacteria bacterium]|nr:MAG: hypothetical protein CSA80_05205 [Candidatus Saccharibacteria bacterium]